MNSTLESATSRDGTWIAFERTGRGPAVILIGGAFNDRGTVGGLASALAPHAMAIAYDRRGRGQSAASTDYAIERELEDLAAVIEAIGEPASVFGHSSGGVLALAAAAQRLPLRNLAVYEPTFVVDTSRPRPGRDLADRVQALVAEGKRDDAAALFLAEAVALPPEMIHGMRTSGAWAYFSGLANSLPFDLAVCGSGMELPAQRLASISVPTLVLNGGNTAPWLAAASRAVAEVVPGAVHRVIEGQDHGVLQQPAALRDVLVEFFS